MKKIIFVIVIIISLASCEKRWICHCDNGTSGIKVKSKKKGVALNECRKKYPTDNCYEATPQ